MNILLWSNRCGAPSLPSSHQSPWLQMEEEQADSWLCNSFHSSHGHLLDSHPLSLWHPPLCHRAPPTATRELSGTPGITLPPSTNIPHSAPRRTQSDNWHCLRAQQWTSKNKTRQWGCIRNTHPTEWNQFLSIGRMKSCPSGPGGSRLCGNGRRSPWWHSGCRQAQEDPLTQPIAVWTVYESQL